MNDMIIIKISGDDDDDDNNHNNQQFLDDTCWNLLRLTNIDSIIFLNETNANHFDLHYPPVESTLRIRQSIDAVLHQGKYLFNMSIFLLENDIEKNVHLFFYFVFLYY